MAKQANPFPILSVVPAAVPATVGRTVTPRPRSVSPDAPMTPAKPKSDLNRRCLAKNIRRLARQRHLNMSQLAEIAGVSRAQLYVVLRGKSSPSLDWLCRVATAFQVEPASLLEGMGEEGAHHRGGFGEEARERQYAQPWSG